MKFPRRIKDAAPLNANRASIERIAELSAKKLGYQPGTDPAATGAKLGIRVTHTTPEQEHDDELIAFADGKVVLSLIDNSVHVDGRAQRNREAVDMAKAIGHLLLHLPAIAAEDKEAAMVVARYPSDAPGQKALQEAHCFAAAFLAPAAKVRELAARGANRGDVAQTLMEKYFLCRTLAKIRVSNILGDEEEKKPKAQADVILLDV